MSDSSDPFKPVCAISAVESGKHKAFEINGSSILMVNLAGRFYAVRNCCTHLAYPLEGGRQMGWEIMCRKHGARFDIRSGKALGGPAVLPLTVYPTRTRADGMVEIALRSSNLLTPDADTV